MTTTAYFDELATLLRERGVPEKEVSATVGDLAAYVTESGADPEEEFGPAAGFAAALAPARPADAPQDDPDPAAETWLWTADAFQDVARLNVYGDQGWEVERIDHLGRFVSRRVPEHPLRWEYRRETALPTRRDALAERLAPDGWEPCGSWVYYHYFKRPKAASEGPAGELDAAPAVPARSVFFGKGLYLFLAGYVLLLAAVAVGWFVNRDGDLGDFLGGILTGVVAGSLAVLAGLLWGRRRRR
ncbi:hypothetical protein ACFOWE_21055 [Planomonospora corallina]|uniref:DUF2812 domain-containing protein n=1 Tax=Planomonospora corallina TaxID=1806052 RepID=A0ABV8I9C5_9ACTN